MVLYQLFYLIGALRDGSVYKYNRNYTVVWYSSSREYLENEIMERLGALGYKSRLDEYKDHHYRVRVFSRKLYKIVVEEFEHPIRTSRKRAPWYTPRRVVISPIKLQIEYLKGFVDAEGSIIRSRKGNQIDISQQIKEPLEHISTLLNNIGIKTTGIYRGPDNVWRLRIASKKALTRFSLLINFRHPQKKKALQNILKEI